MFSRYIISLFLAFVFIMHLTSNAQQAVRPGAVYVPPDAATYGLQTHNEHLAVIQTNCGTVDEAVDLRDALTRSGALVSIMTSPQRMLAWVSPEARDAVLHTSLDGAAGSIAVLSVSYSFGRKIFIG